MEQFTQIEENVYTADAPQTHLRREPSEVFFLELFLGTLRHHDSLYGLPCTLAYNSISYEFLDEL